MPFSVARGFRVASNLPPKPEGLRAPRGHDAPRVTPRRGNAQLAGGLPSAGRGSAVRYGEAERTQPLAKLRGNLRPFPSAACPSEQTAAQRQCGKRGMRFPRFRYRQAPRAELSVRGAFVMAGTVLHALVLLARILSLFIACRCRASGAFSAFPQSPFMPVCRIEPRPTPCAALSQMAANAAVGRLRLPCSRSFGSRIPTRLQFVNTCH